jgi:hypothetical protein
MYIVLKTLTLFHYTPRRHLRERRYSSYSSSTSALDGVGGQCHAPAALYPREKTPGTHCTGGWVGPRAGLDTEATGKISCLCRGSNLDLPVVRRQTLYLLSYPVHSVLSSFLQLTSTRSSGRQEAKSKLNKK